MANNRLPNPLRVPLQEKVALVTGASSGMGKDFAKALIADGATVYGAARRVEMMQDLSELGAILLKLDITREADIEAAVKQIEDEQGGIDILINNAGFGLYGAMEDVSLDEARYQFEVNLFGLARLTQLALPYMRKQRQGKVINISSVGGKIYTPLGSWYHATKHALEGWSDCLRLEVSQFGIDVVIIQPGAIQTEFGDVMTGPMLQRSGDGPYSKLAKGIATLTDESYKKGGSSSPDVITRLVMKAIHSAKPKTRYAAGKYAKPMLFIRKWFGDRFFDRTVSSMIR